MSNPVVERRPPVRMTVRALVMDPVSNMPVVILQNADQSTFLPFEFFLPMKR